jgi:intracellular septation protein
MNSLVKFITDFVPILAFFITYKLYGMIPATIALSITTLIAIIVYYLYHKKLPKMLMISTLIVIILGSITIFSGNTSFVKMKPTAVSLVFAVVLFYGAYYQKGYMKHLFNSAINLSEKNWAILSKRFGILFLIIAILNEIIWRTMPEETWVNFKVFGILVITIAFFISQIPFLQKNQIK